MSQKFQQIIIALFYNCPGKRSIIRSPVLSQNIHSLPYVHYLPHCSLHEMINDYEKTIANIPVVLVPMMKPYVDRVDEAIKPGHTRLSWTSLTVQACK